MYEDYEKTIYWLAKLYEPIFILCDDELDAIASFMSVDANKLKANINNEVKTTTITDSVNDFRILFHLFIKTFKCIKDLNEIERLEDNSDDESISKIISTFRNTVWLMSGLNADLSTHMCLKKHELPTKYAVQEWNTDMSDNISALSYFMEDESSDLDKRALWLCVKSLVYELRTRLNTIYCTGVLILIQSSPYFDEGVKSIARDLYYYLISLLKNCRLIGMKINLLGPIDNISSRGRNDNTTQLLILYGYDNYDSYCLRLDMPHKGVEFLHYNNRTPGTGANEVKSCLFSRDEVKAICEQYSSSPEIINFFISYGEIYALKERNNCSFNNQEEKRIFDLIESEHSHVRFSEVEYCDESVRGFIEVFSAFYKFNREALQSDEYVVHCFNHDRILLLMNYLRISIIHKDVYGEDWGIESQINNIVRTAARYGIKGMDDGPYNIDDVKIIVSYSEERVGNLLTV